MEVNQVQNLEDCLFHTGWGLYYKFIVGLACICHFVYGLSFLTMAYAVALSTCSDVVIPRNYTLRIFSAFLIGCALGGLVTGPLADCYGRKRFLMYSFIALFLTTFTAAFTYNVFIIIGCKLVERLFRLETNATQMKLLTIEVLGKQRRGFWMFFCDFFQVFGYSTVTFLIVLMETATLLNWNHSNFIKPPTWRTMFAVSGGASLILACASGLLEESPRYYLYLGRNYLAFLLIKQLFAINNSNFADNFMIKEEELVGLIKNFDLRYEEPTLYWQKIKKCLWRFWKSVKLMCSNHYFKNCWLLTLLKAPLIAISVFQLNVLLAKLLIYDQSVIEKKFNGLQLIFPIFDRNGTFNSICETNQQTKVFYTNLIVLSSVMMIGPILGMLVIDYIGRKLLAFSSLLIASASFLLMAFLNDVVIQTIIACCIVIHITITYSVISLVNLELFPTAFRATSAEITNIPGYILALFVVNFFETESKLLLIIMGLSYCCLSIFTCFLPETKNRPLEE